MAINFIKKEDLSHITRTTRQWETTIDRYEIIPKGVLCIELCNDKLTKIKIGNGHLIYEQLPYVSDVNLSDYYTKEETNNLIKDLKAIKIKGEASSLSDLPLRGNEEGDLWFIPKSDPDEHSRYDEYIWYKNKWESFGSSDIDLSEYAKKSYVDEHIQEVQNEITEIIESGYLHKHDNKNILDHTSAVYNVEKDNKLRDLHNYDDTELREKAHTHLNKNILDQTDAVYNRDKDDKLRGLHNYDDTDVKDRISTLEGVAHSHSNQDILNRTTAAFTREQALQLLDCKDFVGTDGVHPGYHGFVPAPTKDDIGKVLGANGQWVENGSSGGGDTVAEGGGIEITTDAQTGVKTIAVNAGTGLTIDPNTGELNADAQALEPATTTTLGGVIIGDGISVDNAGVIDVNTGDGLSVNSDNELEVSVGDGLQIDANGAVEVNVGDGLSINASDEVELDKATTSAIGGVIVGDNIDVNNGTISVPKAASNKLGVVKPTDGLSVDSNGVLTVDTGDGLSIDSTTKEVNVNVGRALSINTDNEIDVNIASRSAYGVVKVGEGVNVDSNGIISVEAAPPFRTGDGIILTDESERLPSGFTKIEYVESSSTNVAYTSINYYINANSKFIGRMSKTEPTTNTYGSSPGTVFGTIGSNYTRFMFGFANDSGSSSPLYCGIQCGNSTSPDPWYNNKSSLITSFVLNDIVNFEASVAEGLKLNNELHQTYQVYGGTLPFGRKLGVMAADANGITAGSAFYGRIYFLKIYEGNVLKVSLVPCIQTSSSTPGLYDTVAGTFYASTSGNPFLYDPETIDVEVPDWVLKADIATSSKLGSVKVGSGLSATNDGTLSVNTGDGLTIDANNNLKAKIGVGLHFNEENAIEADEIDIDTYEPGNGISFIRHYARELPVGYTQLEYIESHFDAGFILDYYPQKTSKIVCEAAFVDLNRSNPSDNCLFGSRNGNVSSSKQFVLWFNNKTSDPCYVGFVYTGNTWGDIGEHYTYANMYQRLLFEISPSIGVYCNNVLIQNPLSYPDRDPSPYKLGILCLATSDTGIDTTRNYQSGRIFTFKIYESDTLVVDLVPCLNDSDVPGLYDMVNEVFYSSASGTDFTYDPDAVVTHDSITIDANRGDGIIYDNNALSLNPGAGLSIDATDNQKLNVNLADGLSIKNTSTNAIKINNGDGLSIDSTTNKLNVNIGDGLVKDSSNNIDVNLYDNDFYIKSENNQIRINPLYAPTYDAGNGIQFVSTTPSGLPAGYTRLTYIESKGTSSDRSASILDYVPTKDTKIDMTFEFIKGMSEIAVIGSQTSSNLSTAPHYHLNLGFNTTSKKATAKLLYGQNGSQTVDQFITDLYTPIHVVASKDGVFVDGIQVQTVVATDETMPPYKMRIFTLGSGNDTGYGSAVPLRIHEVKLYEGNVLSAHLIPCLNPNNVPGVYDVVNNVFYQSTWSTAYHYDENDKSRPGYYVQAKLGNGLQFDANNAIEVVNGGTEYTAGDGIDIDTNDEISVKIGNHLSFDQTTGNINVDDIIEYRAGEAISIETVGGLQLTDYSNDDFVTSIASMNAGSIVKAADNSSFTLTASSNDCYTRGPSGEANGSYPYNVKSSTKYRLTWDSSSDVIHGKVYTYENGLYDSWMHEIDQYDQKYLEFTTKAETTFITTRFGVMYAGDSITYSNVRLYEVIEEEDQYDEISVKYGDGLTVNERNELEIKYGNGLEIISNPQYRSEYYFNTQVQCQVHTDNYYTTHTSFDRTFQKTTTEPALCCLWEYSSDGYQWTCPLIVGSTATSVQYTALDLQQTVSYQNTFQYLGETWYTSGYPISINNSDHEDKLGNLQYIGSYGSVSTQIQAAKDLIDLALINAGSLQAKLGDGLAYDANGAITLAGSADAFAAGNGISFTNAAQSNKIKLVISAIKNTSQTGTGAPYTQMRSVEFSDENMDPISIASGEAIWTDGTTVSYASSSETISAMIADTAKMCVEHFTQPLILTFTLSSPVYSESIKYFRYKTGEDASERDPVSWKIYVNDVNAQTTWNQISEGVSEIITGNRNTWTQYFDCEYTAGGTTYINVVPATANTIGGVKIGNGLTVTSDGTISTATGKAYIAGEGINMSSSQYEFSAENEQYLFKSQVTCELHGDFNREFQKTTDDTALGMVWNVYDSSTLYSGPIFVGLSSDAVKYTTNSTTYSALGTFSYLGKTWYYSDHLMYVSNIDGTDYDGNMVVDTETYASTSDIVQAAKDLIDRARVILKVDEISLLPATEDTLGGIKIGEGLSIDENNVVSSTVYEEGQGITFETAGSTDSFDVKNKQYYFDEIISCQISGNFGPRTFTRLSDEPCLMALMKYNTSWCMPIIVGLTAESVDMSQSWDATILHSKGTLDYKGYTWYVNADYGLTYGSMVDLMGNLQTLPDMYTYDTSSYDAFVAEIMDTARDLIDLADVIAAGIKTYDVWNTGTGWLNGSYETGTSDTFWTNWYKEYHSDYTVYFELPEGATEVKLTGISTNDTAFGGNHIDLFNDAKHHIGTFTGESEWHELLTGTVYLQFGVKWNEENTQDISGSQVKSVTLEIKVPKNNAITAKLGDGLTFDENDAITLDESIKLIIHCVGTPLT